MKQENVLRHSEESIFLQENEKIIKYSHRDTRTDELNTIKNNQWRNKLNFFILCAFVALCEKNHLNVVQRFSKLQVFKIIK